MIHWPDIRTVLLDMDGTLLDLHFDNHFWNEHLPQRYAEIHGRSYAEARDMIVENVQKTQHTIDFYCLDHWSALLNVDVAALKTETQHKIAVLPNVIEFLDAVRCRGIRAVLVTNAHGDSLRLKMQVTCLDRHLDGLVCAHDFGLPKEHPDFWDRLQQVEPFEPEHTLFVDDSVPVLTSAEGYGIRHLLCISEPDSQSPTRNIERFQSIRNFSEINPG